MNYREALIYFRDRSDYERGFVSNPFAGDEAAATGLRRTRLLLDQLGSPDRAYPIIHVAGTKGKGSTCAFIESMTRHCGLRTGLFATPQLHSVRERTLIDAQPISESRFAETLGRVAAAVEQVERAHPEAGSLTAFEISTAQSLLAFAEAGVDLAVVEVGMGGRLDATNVVHPAVTVITPVSFDHQAILGDTLSKIAGEKAGIIKPGIPVIAAQQDSEATATIIAIANRHDAPMLLAGRDWSSDWRDGLTTLSGPWGRIAGVRLGLKGPHQALNAGTAMKALWRFNRNLFADHARLRAGLESVSWPGRFEQIADSPPVIVDGAHNAASIQVLVEALRHEFPGCPATVILGSYRDKDLSGMLAALRPLSPALITTRSASLRARDPDEIAATAREQGFDVTTAPTVAAALDLATERVAPNGVIVATGSFSVVAEARDHLGLATISPDEREILSS